jgi:hypothetical protein
MLVSAPGRPLGQVLREQLKANPANAPILHQVLGAIADLEARKSVDSSRLNPALLRLFRPSVQGFLISAFSYDSAKLIAGCEKPILTFCKDSATGRLPVLSTYLGHRNVTYTYWYLSNTPELMRAAAERWRYDGREFWHETQSRLRSTL